MDETKLKEIAYKIKLRGIHIKVFIYFVQIRFPDHTDEIYMEQWGERIRDGNYTVGDSKSRKAIKEAYSKSFEDAESYIENNNG